CRPTGLPQCWKVHVDFRYLCGAPENRQLPLYHAGAQSRRRQRRRRHRWARHRARPNFVVADLPGLIEGAHEGAGLGIRFLRHVERTRLLVHLIDTSEASDRDPIRDHEIICGELRAFSESLAAKPMIVVATKLDATTDRSRL